MTEHRASPDAVAKEESVRLWTYNKGDILFVVTETHYKPDTLEWKNDARSNLISRTNLIMSRFP
jgi:hypothetical protein